jgi:hypothetical protein
MGKVRLNGNKILSFSDLNKMNVEADIEKEEDIQKAQLKKMEQKLRLIDFFAAQIYAQESQDKDEFAWAWLALNDEIQAKYLKKAKSLHDRFVDAGQTGFTKPFYDNYEKWKKEEISSKLARSSGVYSDASVIS